MCNVSGSLPLPPSRRETGDSPRPYSASFLLLLLLSFDSLLPATKRASKRKYFLAKHTFCEKGGFYWLCEPFLILRAVVNSRVLYFGARSCRYLFCNYNNTSLLCDDDGGSGELLGARWYCTGVGRSRIAIKSKGRRRLLCV
jgi:hypothetical protein